MRWVGHEAHMGERRGALQNLVWKLRERDHLEGLDIDGRIILNCIFKLEGGGGVHGQDQSGSRKGQMVGSCECCN